MFVAYAEEKKRRRKEKEEKARFDITPKASEQLSEMYDDDDTRNSKKFHPHKFSRPHKNNQHRKKHVQVTCNHQLLPPSAPTNISMFRTRKLSRKFIKMN